MLLDLTLINFKIWRNTRPVILAPVSLLLGTNSSGKSSIIQSLLLIRQTVRGNDPNTSLNFGTEASGSSVALGQFSDVLNRMSADQRDRKIGIEFTWTPDSTRESALQFSAAYKPTKTDAAEIVRLRIGMGEQSFSVLRQAKGAYSFSIGTSKPSLRARRDFHPQSSFTFSAATFAEMPPAEAEIIRRAGAALLNELSKIIYLGPVRQLARRYYQWSGIPTAGIGDDGGKAIDALIGSGLARKQDHRHLFDQTVSWLNKMGLADGLEIRRLGKSPLYEVWVRRDNVVSNLKDVGVGVSQVLPVIVAALHAEPHHIVLVEEPESHLHPLAQSLLAELFVGVSKERGIQFIVETHSEHLFRRMQTLIAREEIRPSDCALYFVDKVGAEARFRSLEADDLGRVKNWPPHFFGDSLGETKEQTDIMLKRLKEARANNASPAN
jgi:hypothetical protein